MGRKAPGSEHLISWIKRAQIHTRTSKEERKIKIHIIADRSNLSFTIQEQAGVREPHFVLQTTKLSPTIPCMNNLPRLASCTAEVIPEIFVPSSSNTFCTVYFSP